MDKIFQFFVKIQRWVEAHWRIVLVTLCMLIFMQQCTINRLRWEIQHMVQSGALAHDSAATASPDHVTAPDTSVADSLLLHTPTDDEVRQAGESSFSWWTFAIIVVVIAAIGFGIFYALRNAIYPIGISYSGKVKSVGGQLVFAIKVKNRSSKEVELSNAQVNFVMGPSQVRKFRANVPSLPISLQPHTSFEAQINLTGLITANLELAQAKAIGMSVVANGKSHSTIPRPVKIQTA